MSAEGGSVTRQSEQETLRAAGTPVQTRQQKGAKREAEINTMFRRGQDSLGNQSLISLIESLQGDIGSNLDLDFDPGKTRLAGNDPRNERLQRLLSAFQVRQQDILSREAQPGLSQTRLSLVE